MLNFKGHLVYLLSNEKVVSIIVFFLQKFREFLYIRLLYMMKKLDN